MPQLEDTIKHDLIQAQKTSDTATVSILRYVLASIKNVQIENRREVTDEDVLAEVAKEVKRHRESIAQFEQGGRADLVEKEQAEITILQKYLPVQMTEAELYDVVKNAVAQTQATSIKDMGKVISLVKGQVKGRAEGSDISRIVKEHLINP